MQLRMPVTVQLRAALTLPATHCFTLATATIGGSVLPGWPEEAL